MFFKSIKAFRLNHRAAPHADRVMEVLAVREGSVVADLGSGGGYFSFRFSGAVGAGGRVYAVDIDKDFLAIIAKEARRRGIRNIEPLRSGPNGGMLPDESCDLAFMRNAFHHLPSPVAYMRNLRPALRQGAKVAIIEWLPDQPGCFRHHHGTKPEEILETMEKADYELVETYDFLPRQSFNIFAPTQKK